jgi:hypothetical protein
MEHISDSLVSLDDMGSEFFSQVADIDLDDLLIGPCVIDSPDSLCELCLGEDTSSILHEVEEEFVFSS